VETCEQRPGGFSRRCPKWVQSPHGPSRVFVPATSSDPIVWSASWVREGLASVWRAERTDGLLRLHLDKMAAIYSGCVLQRAVHHLGFIEKVRRRGPALLDGNLPVKRALATSAPLARHSRGRTRHSRLPVRTKST